MAAKWSAAAYHWKWQPPRCSSQHPRFPPFGANGHCVKMAADGTWEADHCSQKLPYVCFYMHKTYMSLSKSPTVWQEGQINNKLTCSYPKGIKCCYCAIYLYKRMKKNYKITRLLTGEYTFKKPLSRNDSGVYYCVALQPRDAHDPSKYGAKKYYVSWTNFPRKEIYVRYFDGNPEFAVYEGYKNSKKLITLENGSAFIKSGTIVSFVCSAGPAQPAGTMIFEGESSWLARLGGDWWRHEKSRKKLDTNVLEKISDGGVKITKTRVRQITERQNNYVIMCTVYHPLGVRRSHSIRLQVEEAPIVGTSGNNTIFGTEYGSVNLDCKVINGYPNDFNYTWWKGTKLLKTVRSSEFLHTLSLSSLSLKDDGIYKCQVQNRAGKSAISLQLAVLDSNGNRVSAQSAQKIAEAWSGGRTAGIVLGVLVVVAVVGGLFLLHRRGELKNIGAHSVELWIYVKGVCGKKPDDIAGFCPDGGKKQADIDIRQPTASTH